MEKVKRKSRKDNKTIYCVVPPVLTNQYRDLEIDFNLNNSKQSEYGDFSLSVFLSRYLAGNRSLNEARAVSRKRLALVSSGVGYIDPLAIDLSVQMNKYQEAKAYLMSKENFALDDICQVNRFVAYEHKRSGKIRNSQNWIGGKSLLSAVYICPPPEFVSRLMDNWLTFINDKSIPKEIVAILGHNQFQSIHPFSDGNGRTARAFLQTILEKKYGEIIHPSLYRLNSNSDEYIDAIQFTLEEKNLVAPVHDYWLKSLSWGNRLKQKMYDILASGEIILRQHLAMASLSTNAICLINYLWKQPIVCEAGLFKQFSWDFLTARNTIQELINLNILFPRKLREPNNALIYDCPLIFNIWSQLDDSIFNCD